MSHKVWTKLAVEEVDGTTFRVESESGKAPYFVDVAENGYRGRCTCPDFACNVAAVQSGDKPDTPLTVGMCKHQLRVKLHLADRLLAEMSKHDKNSVYNGP